MRVSPLVTRIIQLGPCAIGKGSGASNKKRIGRPAGSRSIFFRLGVLVAGVLAALDTAGRRMHCVAKDGHNKLLVRSHTVLDSGGRHRPVDRDAGSTLRWWSTILARRALKLAMFDKCNTYV